jgi:acetyltransferase-like isoleucine patch superfamily enzyme
VIIHPHVVINEGVIIGDGVEIFSGAIIGKEPKGAGATARQPKFNKRVSIGVNSSIGPHAVIFYDVEIGKNTLIGDGASIRENCKIGNFSIIGRYVTLNYNVHVGNHVKIMDHAWMAGNMNVGNYVFISGGVLTTNDTTMGAPDNIESMRGPSIEDGAMIGVGATLLSGVIIGKNAIVGAGSVVTSDVEPGTLIMGIPARVVKKVDIKK